MASDSVAKGSIQLSLDATAMNEGLKKAANKAKQGGESVGKQLKGSLNEQLGSKFGGESVLASFGKAGMIGAAVAAAAYLSKEMAGVVMRTEEYNRQLERSVKLNAQWSSMIGDNITRTVSALGEFGKVAATDEGLDARTQAIRRMRDELGKVETQIHRTEKEADKWSSMWKGKDQFQFWMTGSRAEQEKVHRDAVNALRDSHSEKLKLIQQEERLLNELREARTVAGKTAIRGIKQEHEDAARNLNLKPWEQWRQKIVDIKREFGLLAQDEAELNRLGLQRQQAEANRDLVEQIKTTRNELAAVFGEQVKISEEIALEEFVRRGADNAQIERMKLLIAMKKRLTDQYTPLTGIERGTAAEISFRGQQKFNDAKDRALADMVERFNAIGQAQGQKLAQVVGLLLKIATNTGMQKPEI
jgi:hypothetical protein